MSRKYRTASAAQKTTALLVFAALCGIAVWLALVQSRFNPAVLVALQPPQPLSRRQASPTLSTTAGLIPEPAGFIPRGGVETYSPETLSDKINGKAELYLAAAVKEMSCRAFGLDAAYLEVFVYDMQSPKNAFAVFSSQRRPGADTSSLATNAYATPNALFFTQERYYVEIVADRASAPLQRGLETFAAALLKSLGAAESHATTDTAPDQALGEAALFPKQGLALETLRLSAADTFGLEGFNQVFTAEYHLEQGEAAIFLAIRATPAEAAAEAHRFLVFLIANGYKEVMIERPVEGSRTLGLDRSFEVVMTRGRVLAGVHDATSQQAAWALASRLDAALKEKTP